MKIIDLLNKIANDEEIPKKIKFENDIYEYENKECGYVREENGIYYMFMNEIGNWYLNDEVEILEEEKKIPEKLATWFSVEIIGKVEDNIEYENYNFETMYEKINEIIDYLKSKGE